MLLRKFSIHHRIHTRSTQLLSLVNLDVRNGPATKLVMLKVYNIKLSFDIWQVLYMYFILYSWQYLPFKACSPHIEVIWIAAPKGYAMCRGLRALTVLWGF